jgi:LacI family transcriptional regulator
LAITAKELAKMLKLSEAAISMALNNKPGVSTKTRNLVLETAQKYNYDFNKITENRSLTGSIYFIIYKKHGAIVSDTPFFSQLSEGIDAYCKKSNYKLKITYIYEDKDTLNKEIESIRYSDCIGMILLGTEMKPEDFTPFSALNLPLVLLDVYFDSILLDCVLINNIQGAFIATDYLIKHTRKQPGYLQSAYPINNFEQRCEGFYKAVKHHGLSCKQSIIHKLTPSIEGACADMLELLMNGEVTAECYFADNDLIAVGAMKAFQKMGYSIPEDLSIIGFDNIPISAYVEPSLTTVNVPKQYMGELAASRLIQIINSNNSEPVKIEVSTSLAKRNSV